MLVATGLCRDHAAAMDHQIFSEGQTQLFKPLQTARFGVDSKPEDFIFRQENPVAATGLADFSEVCGPEMRWRLEGLADLIIEQYLEQPPCERQ